MTDRELLELLVGKVDSMDSNMKTMQSDMKDMQSEIKSMKTDIKDIQETLEPIKKTCYKVENSLIPNVQILLENHSDLARNVLVAKDIDERVGSLEFDMKVVKNLLKTKAI